MKPRLWSSEVEKRKRRQERKRQAQRVYQNARDEAAMCERATARRAAETVARIDARREPRLVDCGGSLYDMPLRCPTLPRLLEVARLVMPPELVRTPRGDVIIIDDGAGLVEGVKAATEAEARIAAALVTAAGDRGTCPECRKPLTWSCADDGEPDTCECPASADVLPVLTAATPVQETEGE